MEPTDEVSVTLTLAEWLQIRAILAEQVAAFQAQTTRNNATIEKIEEQISPTSPGAKAGPQLVS